MRAANAACLVELLISLESVIGERRSPMHWLAKVYDFIFGCRHDNLSRVFTIGGDTYTVCWLCGIKFPYSLDRMSIVSSEPEPPAQDLLTLGLPRDVALSPSRMRAAV